MKSVLPYFVVEWIQRLLGTSRARKESNAWLRIHCKNIRGNVLSLGSAADSDFQGDHYRNYFINATSYSTSDVSKAFVCDLRLDARSMSAVQNDYYDCVFCSGVLEHIDDFWSALKEITRILEPGGILILGVPFRQGIHLAPHDYWRFTEYGLRHLLKDAYEILSVHPVGARKRRFPVAYWIMARKSE